MQKSAFFSVLARKKKVEDQVNDLLPRSEDKAWLAGIVEGEGSVLWARYGPKEWRAKISIYMNDGAAISQAAHLMGLSPFYDKRRKRWHAYAEGFRAIQVVRLIEPYMVGQKKILAHDMVLLGHIFRAPEPPWHFELAWDHDLQKSVRVLKYAELST